jgi:hypothetical protein
VSAVSYYLFPDRRESPAVVGEANETIKTWSAGPGRNYQAPFGQVSFTSPVSGWVSVAGYWGVPPLEMMTILKGIDWAYPALLVYREAEDDRWSQLLLGLSLRSELGEA